ncbi:MAG: response regulator [Chloroflexota bacterium]
MKNSDTGVKRVLVVEDEPAICAVCRRVLTGEGFEVDIAVNGRVAQDMVEEKQYDLCLVDIRTPKMSGEELYEWLQKKYPQLTSRVIFTTGSMMGGDVVTFIEQSGRPFLPKPFSPSELKNIVRETLKQVEK